MKRGEHLWWTAIGVAVAMLVFANAATAKRGYEVRQGSFGASLQVKGSHGYHLSIHADGHNLVTLSATKGDRSASYTVPGKASRKGIHARFGSLGKVSVRFEGSPVRHRGRPGSDSRCKGRERIRETGAFRGTIRFEGEREFTSVDAHRARGGFYRSFRQVCRKRPSGPDLTFPNDKGSNPRSEVTMTTFVASSRARGRESGLIIIRLEAHLGPRKSDSFFLSFEVADQIERVGKMVIVRNIFREGRRDSMDLSEPGTRPVLATVAPRKPFFGTASYRQDPGFPPTWTGDLAVRLPGTEGVPLTGTGFKTGLCHESSGKKFSACLRKLAGAFGGDGEGAGLRLAQGSGSQSQAFWDVRLSWSR